MCYRHAGDVDVQRIYMQDDMIAYCDHDVKVLYKSTLYTIT